MRRSFSLFAALLVLGSLAVTPAMADSYSLDAAHAGVTFKISHLGLSWTYGRFNDIAGEFVVDAAKPSASSFNFTLKTESIDTGNVKRDEHLKAPDFFNAKQFPVITFKSTAVKVVKDGYEVTGDFTLHGVTKPITFTLVGGKTAEFPKGVFRTGFTGELIIKRSEFGIDKFAEAVGEEVFIAASFEGTKK